MRQRRIIAATAICVGVTVGLLGLPAPANAATVAPYGYGPTPSTVTKAQIKALVKCIEKPKTCKKITYPQITAPDLSVGMTWGGMQITIDQQDAASWWFDAMAGLTLSGTEQLIATVTAISGLAGWLLFAIFAVLGVKLAFELDSAATHQVMVPCGFNYECTIENLWPNWPPLPFKGDGIQIDISWLGAVTFNYITGWGNPLWPVCPCQPNQP